MAKLFSFVFVADHGGLATAPIKLQDPMPEAFQEFIFSGIEFLVINNGVALSSSVYFFIGEERMDLEGVLSVLVKLCLLLKSRYFYAYCNKHRDDDEFLLDATEVTRRLTIKVDAKSFISAWLAQLESGDLEVETIFEVAVSP